MEIDAREDAPLCSLANGDGAGADARTARLPDEILLLVFGHLRPRDLAVAASVCARWLRVAADDSLWRQSCVSAGWDGAARPTCGWRAASRRTVAGSVLVLYTAVSPDQAALSHVTSLVLGARRTLSQAVGSVCAAVDRRGPRRLSSFWVPAIQRGSAAAEVASWMHLGGRRPDLPLAAFDAVAWETPVRGILRLSDSPLVRALRARPMVWLIDCSADRSGAGDAGGDVDGSDDNNRGAVLSGGPDRYRRQRRRFVHIVEQGRGRTGGWTDTGTGTLLWRRQPYEGQWRRGRREGAGTQFYLDGSRYVGGWRDGARHGAGRCDEIDGGGYEGQWRRDHPQGRGRRWWHDGQVHDGTFAGGQPHGPGTFIGHGGMRASGTWHAGVPKNVHWVSPFGPVWPVPFGVAV